MSAPASALAFLATGLALAAVIGALNLGRRPKPFEAGLGAVVFVWTFTAAFAVLLRIYRRYGTLEEDEILEQISQ